MYGVKAKAALTAWRLAHPFLPFQRNRMVSTLEPVLARQASQSKFLPA